MTDTISCEGAESANQPRSDRWATKTVEATGQDFDIRGQMLLQGAAVSPTEHGGLIYTLQDGMDDLTLVYIPKVGCYLTMKLHGAVSGAREAHQVRVLWQQWESRKQTVDRRPDP